MQVNIEFMRTFVRLREMLTAHKDLVRKVEQIEKKYQEQFQFAFEAITQHFEEDEKSEKKIGYIKEPRYKYEKSTFQDAALLCNITKNNL